MPGDPNGHHCILTARLGTVQMQVHGWGPCQCKLSEAWSWGQGKTARRKEEVAQKAAPQQDEAGHILSRRVLLPSSPEDTVALWKQEFNCTETSCRNSGAK